MDYRNETNQDIFQIEVDEVAKSYMLETARWAKFLAILGFIAVGLVFLLAIVLFIFIIGNGNAFDLSNGSQIGFKALVYAIGAPLYFYPAYALYKFSRLIKTALVTSNKLLFDNALKYLKGLFKYLGILAIINIALVGLGIALVAIASAFH
ncbi:MAG TPA: hypothetical protein VN721_12025 [Flavipsychrobacter sp.]|nr:hypothetical protein [Flavipsychrobacter sp.]